MESDPNPESYTSDSGEGLLVGDEIQEWSEMDKKRNRVPIVTNQNT